MLRARDFVDRVRNAFRWRVLPSDDVLSGLVGHPVTEPDLYRQALRHRSMHHDAVDRALHSNERLEFLGDALLGFIVGDYLYRHFEGRDEGFLTRMRSKLVNGKSLAEQARRLNLGDYVELSANAEKSLGRASGSILADAYEALVGAVYLDLGLEQARSFVHETLLADKDLEKLAHKRDNFKSLLLEYVQGRGWSQPVYEVISSAGPDHRKMFTVGAIVENKCYGSGTATSKKSAEQQAAREALEQLRQEAAEPLESRGSGF